MFTYIYKNNINSENLILNKYIFNQVVTFKNYVNVTIIKSFQNQIWHPMLPIIKVLSLHFINYQKKKIYIF